MGIEKGSIAFKTKVDIVESKRRLLELKKLIGEVGGINMAGNAPATTANFTAAQGRMTAAMRASLLETQRLTQEGVRLRNEYEQGRITAQQLTAQTRALNEQRRQEVAAQRAARQAQVAATGSYREAQQRLTQLGNSIRSVSGGFAAVGPIQQARIREYNELNQRLQAFDRTMGNHQRNVGNYRSALSGVKGELAGLATTFLSASAAIAAIGSAFNQSLKSDAVRTSLEFTFGSVDLADAKLEQLLDTSNRLGVNYNALTTSYKSFTGAVVASNFDFQEGERIFNSVAGASSRLKLSSEDTEGALRALQQMISKGNVQAEELRGQLGERIPGAFSIAARAMGVTETQLNKMLQKGEVLAAELLPKLSIELEKTFGLESKQQIEGMTAEFERFKNIFTGLISESSNTSNFFATVIKGFNEIFGSITALVNSDSWNELWTRLVTGNEAGDTIKGIAKSAELSKAAIEKTLSLNENSSVKDRAMSYEQLSLAHEKATKTLDLLNKKIKDGGVTDIDGLDGKRLKNDIALLDSKMKSEKAIMDKMKPKTVVGKSPQQLSEEKKAERAMNAALTARNSLQQKIDILTKKGINKQLSADEEELESVKDKYKKMRDEAIKFNNDPGNKKKGLRVDSGGLLRAEVSEQDSIRDKQAAAKLKLSLDDQKKMYDDYESYKDKVGKEAADKRYAELIDTHRTYLEKLEIQRAAITDPQKNKGGSEEDVKASEEQLKVLDKEIANEKLANQKKQDDLVASLIDYHQQRKVLIEKYNRDLEIIGDNQTSKDQRNKLFEKELKELNFANLKKLESYEALFKGIDLLSERSALKQLEFARKALDKDILSGSITDPDEIAKIKAYFNQVEQTIKEGSGKAIKDLGSAFSEVGSEISKVNSELGNMLSAAGSILSKVGDIKAGFKEFELAKTKGDGLGQLSAGLGIFGAGVSIFQSVVKLFDRSAQREAQAAYSRDLQIKQTEAVNKALERQIALLSDAYGTDRLVKYAEALKQAAEDEKKYQDQLGGKFQLTGNKELDDLISKINAGEKRIYAGATEDFIKKNQAQFDKLKLPSDFNALQKLLDEGKLDATTSIIVQNLIKAGEAAKELKNQLNAENVGSSLTQIADDFIKTLTGGTQDFGKSFEDTVRTSLLNGFKGELIRKQLQTFYDQFADLTKDGGLSATDIEALRKVYDNAAEKAKADIENLEKATGIKLTDTTKEEASPNSLKGAYATASQESITLLAGQTSGMRIAQIETNNLLRPIGKSMGELFNIAKDSFDIAVKTERNTFKTANNTDRLENIETQLIQMNRKIGNSANAAKTAGF